MAAFTYTAPTVGGSSDTWGTTLNQNWSNLSTFLGTLDSAELAVLDGLTASTAELNYVDGVTSAIQTQIDAKAPLASPDFTGTVGIGANWTVTQSGTDLKFAYNGTDRMKLDASGNLTVEGNVTAYGSA
jgi:hypothetical protein|tara:strand:+ start:938 stop:1324 length:387 start_codon:yes stop_codon:yes gene_type:complete